MDTTAALQMSDGIRTRVVGRDRIGVTELARSNKWRDRLLSCDVMEIVDRGATAGWLLSEQGMQSLLDTISYFEAEAERTQVAYIVEARSRYRDWKSGDGLGAAVLERGPEKLASLRAAFDGD